MVIFIYDNALSELKSLIFWNIMPCSTLKSTDVSENHVAPIFNVEE
jgi:hypothetical protein